MEAYVFHGQDYQGTKDSSTSDWDSYHYTPQHTPLEDQETVSQHQELSTYHTQPEVLDFVGPYHTPLVVPDFLICRSVSWGSLLLLLLRLPRVH